MENLLLKIMAESFERKQADEKKQVKNLPFITISREYGCQGNLLAVMLKQELDKGGIPWRIVNKEIIYNAAKELNLHPDKISNISGAVNRTQMDEVLHALSTKYYKSDRKIRQTVASVVMNTALSGHAIIVGRAGAAITRDLHPAIHIHMIAPIEWRLNSLLKRNGLKREETLKDLTSTDHKRYKLIRDYLKWAEPNEQLFDLTINCSTVSHLETLELIMKLAAMRKII